ncbi:type II toxin-antitoxin system RelE/ParE family toxin [Methylocystis sp. 9N]|uniref:Type II toxin-antitoxin system RelE/ParE family toxin n=1 Tax=Methylocystis borbori TaxID=3118750 RepID=A0ABU7XE51_9HYPH
MAIEFRWSKQAREDLLQIYVTIGADNVAAAERVYDRLEQLAAMLKEQPRLGLRRKDIQPKVRMLVERPYLILYELTPDTDRGTVELIEIVRVVDGRRDLRTNSS